MASPAPAELPNGMSTPPTTASGGPNASPTAGSTQPNTQSQSQQPSQLSNGQPAPPPPPAHPLLSVQDDGDLRRPLNARLVHLVLARAGVHAYTERVPLQIMDFAYRYTSGILSDAIAYDPPSHNASSSKKAAQNQDDTVSINAVRSAVSARVANAFQPALPKEFMAELAAERNKVALPRLTEREFGLRLPPERYCFTGVGWDVKPAWEDEEDVDEDADGAAMAGGPVGGITAGVDTVMGGMGEDGEEGDEDEFEEVMGRGDEEMRDG